MRMRRKKYLDERIENCGGWLLPFHTEGLDARAAILEPEYIDYYELFGNDNPVELEVGCGKGGFICQLAKLHPDVNYIAVEKQQNVIVSACERAKLENLTNVLFMDIGAAYLQKYLPPKSISRIYLNFSCPFPKRHFANRRLTSPHFLKVYKALLAEGAEIHQKTDNMHLFEYSIEQFSSHGFALKNVSLDLHNSGFEGNIETEYEIKFSSAGFPIYRLEAYLIEQL